MANAIKTSMSDTINKSKKNITNVLKKQLNIHKQFNETKV